MEKENKFPPAPCEGKKCMKCCDPVLMNPKSSIKDGNLPKDETDKDIWIKRDNEKWIPNRYGLDAPELDVYDCIYLDKEGRRCKAYDKRPEPCKSTSCEKNGLIFEKVQEQKFDKKILREK